MTGDQPLKDFQIWASSVLELLSADAASQIEYLDRSGVGPDELLLQLDDVVHVALAKMAAGSLSQEDCSTLKSVQDSSRSFDSASDFTWTIDALRDAPEWKKLRQVSRIAKEFLEKSWVSRY
jgi:hypothetical protein